CRLRNGLQGRLRRAREHSTVRMESRTVTRTVPSSFGIVPMDETTEMCAYRRHAVDLAIGVAGARDPFTVLDDHLSAAASYGAGRFGLGRWESVPEQIIRIVQALLEQPPRAAANLLAVDVEQRLPRILATERAIAGHHGSQSAKRHAVAGETGGDELV